MVDVTTSSEDNNTTHTRRRTTANTHGPRELERQLNRILERIQMIRKRERIIPNDRRHYTSERARRVERDVRLVLF